MTNENPAPFPFSKRPAVVGMLHLGALPGTPRDRGELGELVRATKDEARLLATRGCDGVLIENMHDRPYLRRAVGPEIVAAMTASSRRCGATVAFRPTRCGGISRCSTSISTPRTGAVSAPLTRPAGRA